MAKEINPKIKSLKRECQGFYEEIAKECGMSKSAVAQVLNQEYFNLDIVNAAITVRDRKRAEKEQVISKI